MVQYKSSKLLLCLCLLIILLCIGVLVPNDVYAESLNNDEYDYVFKQTVNELASEKYQGNLDVFANKKMIYDYNLNSLGYVYEFVINSEQGYAIVINDENGISVKEVFFNTSSPYANVEDDSQCVYLCEYNYLQSKNNEFFTANTDEIIELDNNGRYYSATGVEVYSTTETISYKSKNTSEHKLAIRYPKCGESPNLENECIPVLGTNIIHYWDRFKPNLIPNFVPGREIRGKYIYNNGDTATISRVMNELYSLMNTNVNHPGVTVTEFKQGMNTYCNNHGYSFRPISVMTNNSVNYTAAKGKLDMDYPIIVFAFDYTMTDIHENDGSDTLQNTKYNVAHGFVCFAYKDITYTLHNNSVIKKHYFEIVSGDGVSSGYVEINNMNIHDAYALVIE